MHYAELRQVREELTGPGGQFEITEAEVLGNRLRVFKNAPPSVRELWLSSVAFAERPYLIYEGEVMTYAQSHEAVNSVAAWLFAQGIQPGDRRSSRLWFGQERHFALLVRWAEPLGSL